MFTEFVKVVYLAWLSTYTIIDATPTGAAAPAMILTGEPMVLPLTGLQTLTPVDVAEQVPGLGDVLLEVKNSLMLGALEAAPGKLLIPNAVMINLSVL